MHICANLSAGNIIEEMLDVKYGLLDHVERVLEQVEVDTELLENTLWMLSNIIYDNEEACSRILEETQIIDSLLSYTSKSDLDPLIAE